MDIHEIDAHLDSFVAAEAPASTNEASLKLFDICQVYAKVRPVIKFARGLLFWKPKWQHVIDEAMAALDLSCEIPQ